MLDTDVKNKKNSLDYLVNQQSQPYELFNSEGSSSALVVCDHASCTIPGEFENLGLPDHHLDKHIAWDIGAAEVAKLVAKYIDAAGVLARYSRLLVDCNRHLNDPSAFPAISDGVAVPGNQNLSDYQRQERAKRFFWPYHAQVAHRLNKISERHTQATLISIHSFTPVMEGFTRPWKMGVLWDEDPTIPVPLMDKLRERIGHQYVGDNQPYSGKDPADFTVDYHVENTGVSHASIEIRQDLLDSEAGVHKWGTVLAQVLSEVLG